MKKILLMLSATLLCSSNIVFAATPTTKIKAPAAKALSAHGPYISAEVGYVDPHNSQTTDVWADMVLPFITKSGGRAAVGYRFNDYVALEAGYDGYVNKSETSAVAGNTTNRNAKIRGFDVVAKGIVPLKYGLAFFGKVGGTRMHQKINNTLNNTPTYTSDVTKFMLVAGAGFSYNFNPVIAINLSATRTFGSGAIKSIDFASLGVTLTIPMAW